VTTSAASRMKKTRVWIAYWRQFAWFYVWKWTRRIPWLHRRTIYPVNHARQSYLDLHREQWPGRS
jgi:hypothetical protein